MILGIDATNLRLGGGITHIAELLRSVDVKKYGISKVIIWGGIEALESIKNQSWLKKVNPSDLNRGLLKRTLWQLFKLTSAAKSFNCDLLFIPGGTYLGSFRPFITINQNLLPFEWSQLKRYGWTLTSFKLLLLRWTQSLTFNNADGVIFLSKYANKIVSKVAGPFTGKTIIIPHGISAQFKVESREHKSIKEFSNKNPFNILYVSIIDEYKHQWNVIRGVDQLRQKTKYPLSINLVGPAYRPSLKRLRRLIQKFYPNESWIRYHGSVPYNQLKKIYVEADLGIWASSCETFGMILLEKMVACLPIACSNYNPMSQILGDGGVYFDPEKPDQISDSLEQLVNSPKLRKLNANIAYERTKKYSWESCANKTFSFIKIIFSESISKKN